MPSAAYLSGQAALVTGATSGIGRAIALALARAGASVVVNYHAHPEEGEAVVQEIRQGGGQGVAIGADVSREEEVAAMFRQAVEEFGTLDILVNNAGIQQDIPFVKMSLADWRQVLAVNLTGSFLCAREAAREFCRRGVAPERSRAAGKILFISSVHEVIPWAGHVNYAASKGGIGQLMRSLAQELAPERIRVNSIAPGAIKTDINRHDWEEPEAAAKLCKLIPYGRIGDTDDVASVAVWLLSDEADYITGTTIFVDGGMLLYPGFGTGG
ncbi:MAG: glucose 1-dehydrogenase [Desulfuromonadales bacterium]|nr:glucose 1-dehydrogenase [Desulfuromonadales bacterium]